MADRETNTAPIKMVLALAHFEDMVRRHACGDRSGTAVEAARAAVLALAAPAAQGATQEPAGWQCRERSVGYAWTDWRETETHLTRGKSAPFTEWLSGAEFEFRPYYLAPVGQAEDAARQDLRKFLNVAAGEGYVFDGVDASDLYIALFPEEFREQAQQAGQAETGEPT